MMDLSSFLSLIWARKFTVVKSCAVALVIAVLIVIFAPKTYQAETLILVDQSRTPKQEGTSDAYTTSISAERYLKSQLKIAQGIPVLVEALAKIQSSDQKEYAELPAEGQSSFIGRFLRAIRGSKEGNVDPRVVKMQGNLRVEQEPNTDLIRVEYRDNDPVKSAVFAKFISESFIERNNSLYSNPLAEKFFRDQVEQSRLRFAQASKALEDFAKKNQVYSIENQRRLLLTRRDKVLSDLSTTKSSINRIQGEVDSLKTQISSLKARINLPTEIFGPSNFSNKPETNQGSGFASDPSLLHVKLYQESVQKIINLNSELSGLRASEANQVKDVQDAGNELNKLASVAETYTRLESEVTQAETNISLYTKKSSEAAIQNAWRTNDRLSNLQLVQQATVPDKPSFPRASIMIPLALLVGMMVGCALIALSALQKKGTEDQPHILSLAA